MEPPPQPPRDAVSFDASMLVGVPAIDDQHRQLFVELNRLIAATHAAPSSEIFTEGLGRLGRDLNEHFNCEEALLGDLGLPVPELRAHVRAHNEILSQYAELNLKLMRVNAVSRVEVLQMIRRWIVDHIVLHDRQIRDHLPV